MRWESTQRAAIEPGAFAQELPKASPCWLPALQKPARLINGCMLGWTRCLAKSGLLTGLYWHLCYLIGVVFLQSDFSSGTPSSERWSVIPVSEIWWHISNMIGLVVLLVFYWYGCFPVSVRYDETSAIRLVWRHPSHLTGPLAPLVSFQYDGAPGICIVWRHQFYLTSLTAILVPYWSVDYTW